MKKNAFTLIELLAVIVILAIIALIAVPIVVNIINDSKKESMQRSIDLYIDHVGKAVAKYQLAHPDFNPSICTIKEKGNLDCNGTEIQVEMKGQTPESGVIKFQNNKIRYNVILEDIEYTMSIDGTKQSQKAPSSATGEDYRGYYADVDGDGEVDGIIYADLGANIEYPQSGDYHSNSPNSGQGFGTYSYTKGSNLNEYTVSNNVYKKNEGFGENKIIKLKKNKENPRFYVMALEDFREGSFEVGNSACIGGYRDCSPGTYYWYKNAYEKMSTWETDTSTDFGTGYTNTGNIIEIWNKNGEGTGSYSEAIQDDHDIFKHIQSEYAKGWYIPSSGEWAAFADYFGIISDYDTGEYVANSGNYNSLYGLFDSYWTSSQHITNSVRYVDLSWGRFFGISVRDNKYARLGTTF